MRLAFDLTLPSLSLSFVVCLIIAIVALRQHLFGGEVGYWLALYATVTSLWALAQIGQRLGLLAAFREEFLARLPLYGLLILAWMFLHLTRSFLRLEGPGWNWWWPGVVWIAGLLLLDLNALRLPEVLISTPAWVVTRQGITFGMLMVGWGIFISAASLLTVRVYRQTMQPLHHNRIRYWVPILALIVLSDALFLMGRVGLSSGFRLLGICLTAYAVLTHRLPDVRHTAREGLSYLITIALAVGLYVAGFLIAQSIFREAPPYRPILPGTILAIVVAFLFSPVFKRVQRLTDRLISRASYDPSQIVREYSLSISNVLDLEQLAKAALSIIRDALGTQTGAIFVVDHRTREDGSEYVRLRDVRDVKARTANMGLLSANGPVAEYLSHEYRPLTQYDIDLLPRFRETPTAERAYLSSLGMDVYVPIYSQGNWIGLLALGPKISRDRYFDDDLVLLSTLADQTTVALENAHLVANLAQLNRDLQQAYDAVDQANQQLEHLDQAKSTFIAVLSHELRTPLGLLLGYSQILSDDPQMKQDPDHHQILDGLQKGALRLQEIIESMLDMAALDNRTLQLYRVVTPILPLIQNVCAEFQAALTERHLSLEVADELSRLPEVDVDPEALKKVFYHLIANAIKYTPDGGEIKIFGWPLPSEQAKLPEGGVEIIVSDTGIGIDPRFHELIFTKFYQTGEVALHSSGKTKFKGGGPGLGLTLARGIVEAHGGRIWVESPGYNEETYPGSQFHVVLPLRQVG
jgi:signal transduction histidine kinase